MNKSVLLIIEGTYPWYRGGVSEWVYQYLKNLKSLDFYILQVATDEFQQLDPHNALYPLTDNLKGFCRVPPPVLKDNWERDKEVWFQSIIEFIPDWGTDLIHVTNTGFAGWLGVKLSELSKKPLVLTEHALYWKEVEKGAVALECGYKIPDNLQAKEEVVSIFKDISKEVYKSSQKVISVSRINIPFQIQFGADKPCYIPNGIPESLLNPLKERKSNPVIAWVGRCAEMKNPRLFFEVVSEFRKTSLQPKFVMMLSGANEKDLEKEVNKIASAYPEIRMIWNENATDYLTKFDMICITSHNESQPLVLFEALSNKALPIGWEVGDVTSEFAFTVDRSISTSDFVKSVESLWNDQQRFETMIEDRYRLVESNHTWESIFKEYEDIFNTLIAKEIVNG